ncbi:MAG: hypothetical protein QM811_12270 [Pirellulales bacterium]
MRSFAFALLATTLSVGIASAQNTPYNPYADSNDFKVPVEADGTINWPTFYKDADYAARFKWYSEFGACRGTNKAINAQLENNKVDVSKLPVQTVTGKSIAAKPGEIALLDADDKPVVAVMHPKGVTKLVVAGRMPLNQLKPGQFVRLAVEVDAKGHAKDPIKGIEVFTPEEKFTMTKAEGGRLENHAGRIISAKNGKLHVKLANGKIPQIELPVDKDTIVAVSGSQLELIGPGDEIKVVGHVYSGAGVKERRLFCSEITVTKHDGREKAEKPADNTTASNSAK